MLYGQKLADPALMRIRLNIVGHHLDRGQHPMNDLDHLDFRLGPELQAQGGILDRLDYRRIRRLGVHLRDIPSPHPHDDWDIDPSSLEGWIMSYASTVETVQIAHVSGLLPLMKENSEEIRKLLSLETIPALDAQIVEQKELEELIAHAKEQDRFKDFDFEQFSSKAPTGEEIARVIVVQQGVYGWDDRPKVDKSVGLKRLQVGALIGKAAIGGALAVGNLSLGVLGGLSVLPAISLTNVPIAVGLVTSVYTGLAAAFDAIEKIATAIRG